ncbi:MAG: hypothetical protein JWM40_2963 [Frankiales bacterium]|nr:hypothetical protein [Frankiales bacterium]
MTGQDDGAEAAPLAHPTGWFHSEKSVAAHFFEDGHPACQDSDPGEIVPREPDEKSIGRTCKDCVRVIKSRVLHGMRVLTQGEHRG